MPNVDRLWHLAVMLSTAVLIMACGSGHQATSTKPSAFYRGTVHPTCAPWDGAALELVLDRTGGNGPHQMHIQLWRGNPPAPGETLLLSSDSRGSGLALLCAEDGGCAPIDRAKITFSSPPDDRFLHGRVRANPASMDWTLQAEFSAARSDGPPRLCG